MEEEEESRLRVYQTPDNLYLGTYTESGLIFILPLVVSAVAVALAVPVDIGDLDAAARTATPSRSASVARYQA